MLYLDRALQLVKRAKERELLFGMHCSSTSEQIMEAIGMAGADYMIIGMEIEQLDLSQLESLLRVADSVGVPTMVKLRRNDPLLAVDAFNAGAHFVMAPHMKTADDVEAMIKASRFAPEGIRSVCPVARYVQYGTVSSAVAVEATHRYPMVIPIIEDKEALDNLDDILSIPNLGIIEVGPWDMSQSLGCKNPDRSYDNPETWEALELVAAKCRERNLPMLGPLYAPKEMTSVEVIKFQREKLLPLGINMVYGCDMFLASRYVKTMIKATRETA